MNDLPILTRDELITTVGKLGKIIDYLQAYIRQLRKRKLRAIIRVVQVTHK